MNSIADKKIKISAVIITKNEERDIGECLESIKWCDEIIVVDDFSSDRTVELCRKFTTKVFVKKLSDFSQQRNFAIAQACGDWILSIDADERATPELRDEILSVIKEAKYGVYFIPRKNIFLGKWIKRGAWYPDSHIRLFKHDGIQWSGDVHEFITTQGRRVGRIKAFFLHPEMHKDITHQVQKSNFYSTLEAEGYRKDHKTYLFLTVILKPLWVFFKRYFILFGFLDGKEGFLLNALVSYYLFLSEAKKWEIINKK